MNKTLFFSSWTFTKIPHLELHVQRYNEEKKIGVHFTGDARKFWTHGLKIQVSFLDLNYNFLETIVLFMPVWKTSYAKVPKKSRFIKITKRPTGSCFSFPTPRVFKINE